MKILFVTNRYPTTSTPGDSPCIEQQARSLRRRGHDVDVLWIASQHTKLAYISSAIRLLWQVQVRGNYDIVHSHFGWTNAILGAMQWRVPHVITLRGSDVMVPRQLRVTRPLVRRAAASIIMSQEMVGVLGEPTHVIPYGIDMEIYKPQPREEARTMLGLPHDTPLVLWPYDPTRQRKRFDLATAAMNIVREQLPDVNIITIYDKTPHQVAMYMNACDALLMTSNWEGSPSAVREAMACNLGVVSADIGDVRDHLTDQPSCAVVPQEPAAFANALLPLLCSPHRPDLRDAAAQTSYAAIAMQVERVYTDVLGSGRWKRQHLLFGRLVWKQLFEEVRYMMQG